MSVSQIMISIITPSFNRAEMITNAIASVLGQGFEAFEHIIVDGGSTDGTLQLLKRYPHLRVIGGPDRGMYDALNKGLEAATGEIIGFLNTDDTYAEGIFPIVASKFNDPEVMAVAGCAIVFSQLPDGQIKIVNQYSPEERDLMECSTVGSNFFNAWFFRRSTFDRIGRFNPDYRIAGDRDLMFRFALSNLRYAAIDNLIYKYHQHEDSLTFDKGGQKRAWSADEHLVMTKFYLADQALPDTVRKLLIQKRTAETVDMDARSLWMRNHRKFIYYSTEGLKYDFAWPLKFIQYIFERGFHLTWAKLTGTTVR